MTCFMVRPEAEWLQYLLGQW